MSKETIGMPSLIDNQPIKQGEMSDGAMIAIALGFTFFTIICFAMFGGDKG